MKKPLLVLIALMAYGISFAQEGTIIYTDFEPDLYKKYHYGYNNLGTPTHLDIDQDGENELIFRGKHNHHLTGITVEMLVEGYYSGPEYGHFFYWRIPYESIGDTLSGHFASYPRVEYSEMGYCRDFVGIQYQPDLSVEDYCWGWIEVSANGTETNEWDYGPFDIGFTIYSMAFCTILNYPLRVGQTSFYWGVEENEATAFAAVHPNPTTGQVTITGKDLKKAEVVNTLGQRVATATGEGNQLTIDLGGLPSGVYYVNITDKDGRKCVRKVVKE